MVMDITVSPVWLHDAWMGVTKFDVRPKLTAAQDTIEVVIFREQGASMRMTKRAVPHNGECTIEITDGMRAYVKALKHFASVRLQVKEKTLIMTAESSGAAVQYHFPTVKFAEDNHIPCSPADMPVTIYSQDWLAICQTMPVKGQVTIQCEANKRNITLRHSKGRWAAGIMAKDPACQTKCFETSSGAMKFVCQALQPQPSFSKLIFMVCGVLRWDSDGHSAYMAPYEE